LAKTVAYRQNYLSYLLAALVVVIMGCGVAVSGSSQSFSLSGRTMGTSYSIKCWSDSPAATNAVLQVAVDALLNRINQQMSTYLPESELSQFNRTTSGKWFEVSAETAYVCRQALQINQRTAGASDVTVGPLVQLWDFGPGRHQLGSKLENPSAELIQQTRTRIGAEHLEVKLDPPALRKSKKALEVDLSSIAKGYAVDAVAELLAKRGVKNFMVEIGGEVRASGTRSDGQPWRIGLEAPNLNERSIYKVIALADQSLATSGDYRNFRIVDGKKVSHIIDPQTGRPLPYHGWSVTLLTPTCLEADALATALLVMGEGQGYNWCVENKIAALFLIREEAEIRERATPQFLALTTASSPVPTR